MRLRLTWNLVLWVVVLLPLALIVYGYVAKPEWVGVADKTLWDWAELLIIPLVIASLAFFFNSRMQMHQEHRVQQAQKEREEVAVHQARQDAALQEYLRQIVQLASDHKLSDTELGDPLRELVRVLTIMTLEQVDRFHKHTVLRILHEMNLIAGDNGQPIVALDNADLREANLQGADLRYAGLRRVDMRKADLRGAELHGADLSDAKLDKADLSGAKVTEEQLSQCSLEGATMPNGLKYEDWLKDTEEGDGDDRENADPS